MRLFFLISFALQFLLFPMNLSAESYLNTGKDSAPYSAAEHLFSAKTWIIHSPENFIEGAWQNEKFVFEKGGPYAEIKTITANYAENRVDVIRMNPIAEALRRIQFTDVPRGEKLIFHYGVDVKRKDEAASYINVSIFAGRHKLKHLRIPVDKLNQSVEINLGILGFWDRSSTIIVEVTMDSRENPFFFFDLKIKEKSGRN